MILFLACQSLGGGPVSFEQGKTVTIVRDDASHLGFPDILKLPGGNLLLAYRQGQRHSDPSGRLILMTGSPGGDQWSSPVPLAGESGEDYRDPSLFFLPRGEIGLSFFRYKISRKEEDLLIYHKISLIRLSGFIPEKEEIVLKESVDPDDARLDSRGFWVDDTGQPLMVDASTSPVITGPGGILYLPAYRGHTLNVKALSSAPRSYIALLKSLDHGVTWKEERLSFEGLDERLWLMEPALLFLGDNRILLHFRTSREDNPGAPGEMIQALYAPGRGVLSWNSLGVLGQAPFLKRLSGGVILSAYREVDSRGEKSWVTFICSRDKGKTWSTPQRITFLDEEDGGYPSVVELNPLRLLIVYYADNGRTIKGTFLSRGNF